VELVPRVLIDTNIAIFLTRDNDYARRARRAVESYAIAVSFYTAAELLMTARKAADPIATRQYWHDRFEDGRIAVLWPDIETCQVWAEINGDALNAGRPLPLSDSWVAATAVRYGLPLVTHNMKHFEPIPDLELIPLPESEPTVLG
jgi:tRNA(fMet)-specific endonuclease VapC